MQFNGTDAAGGRVSLLNDDEDTPLVPPPPQLTSLPVRLRPISVQTSAVSSPGEVLDTRQNPWGARNECSSPLSPTSNGYHTPQHSPSSLSYQSVPHQTYYETNNSLSNYQYPPPPPPPTALMNGPYIYLQHQLYYSPPNPSAIPPRQRYAPTQFPASNHPPTTHPTAHEEREPVRGEGKRHACRFAEEFNCEKTFTTSGHASRHSKIHTAEKAVPCKHPGCDRKFTRSDNMKQHMETHIKKKRGTEHGMRKPSYNGAPKSREASYSPTDAMGVLAQVAVEESRR